MSSQNVSYILNGISKIFLSLYTEIDIKNTEIDIKNQKNTWVMVKNSYLFNSKYYTVALINSIFKNSS